MRPYPRLADPDLRDPQTASLGIFTESVPVTMYIVGGRNKKNAMRLEAHEGFERGLVLSLNENGSFQRVDFEYDAPSVVLPARNPSVLFNAATLEGDRLYLCTQTEVMVYRVPEFARLAYVSLPVFNDLHHVVPSGSGTLLIADTGLDAVLEVTETGELLREWELFAGGDLWQRFSKSVDYRLVPTTQPHLVHPNYIFRIGDDVWVTRLEQQDALRILPTEAKIPIGVERPHDGIVFGGNVYFTIVDGHIVRANAARCAVEEVVDLQPIFNTPYPLGWCRGIKVLGRDRIIVGFTRLRPTAIQANVRWVRRRLKAALGINAEGEWGSFPTRVASIDLAEKKVLWETNLEPYGMHAVFSIL